MGSEQIYWIVEFLDVLVAYIALMFIWPSVMFRRHLKDRSKTYHFAFVTTAQVLLLNMVILMAGLLGLLRPWFMRVLFYAPVLVILGRFLWKHREKLVHLRRWITGVYGPKMMVETVFSGLYQLIRQSVRRFWDKYREHMAEYMILTAVIAYGVLYFIYGAFQVHSYGASDLYVHHSWISEMVKGTVFSAGVYPQAMHCFVYGIHVLFGIEVYSALVFLGGIHLITFFVAVYCFLKELFGWRYSSLIVLLLFVILGAENAQLIASMARLQWTLPQEFGFFAMFVCALYLLKYVKNRHLAEEKWYRDENLRIFMMALACTVAIHFYTTFIAFFLCLGVAICFAREVFSKRKFVPLVLSVLMGVIVAFAPMAVSLLAGTPFQGSINWGLNIIKNTAEAVRPSGSSASSGNSSQKEEESAEHPHLIIGGGLKEEADDVIIDGDDNDPQDPVQSQDSEKEKSGVALFVSQIKDKADLIYMNTYGNLYGIKWAPVYAVLSGVALVLPLAYLCVRRICGKRVGDHMSIFVAYYVLLAARIVYTIAYCATNLGLPSLIQNTRLLVMLHLLLLAVIVIPVDFVFVLLDNRQVPKKHLRTTSVILCAVICFIVPLAGLYHDYLFYGLTRYNAAVNLTNQITRELPEHTYTVVSVTDELYHVEAKGRHEEAMTFLENVESGEHYVLPTEHIFVYVEKKALQYYQNHFFDGPQWLAGTGNTEYFSWNHSQAPEVNGWEISSEYVQESFRKYSKLFDSYSNIQNRRIIESKLYAWCQVFAEYHPNQIKVMYEDDNFVCYRIKQNPMNLFELAFEYY